MKKTIILYVLLILASSLFAQSKLKKETTTASGHKSVSLFDRENGMLLCTEIWDSSRLQTKMKSIAYRKNSYKYDAQKRIIVQDYTQLLSDADGKKQSSNRTLYKTQYGNPEIWSELHWDSENKLKDSTQVRTQFSADNLKLESTHTVYLATMSTPYISQKVKYGYDAARCLTSSKYMNYDSLQQETGFSENYYTSTTNCLTDTYVHIYKDEKFKKDTIEISQYTYKDNQKDVFIRSFYGHWNCYYGLFDSTHTIKNDDDRLVSEKSWRGNTHTFKAFTYLKNGKIDYIYTDFLNPKTVWKSVSYHHYDAYDSLILITNYSIKNGKVDSTDTDLVREITYERNNANKIIKITDYDYDNSSAITAFAYDCDGRVKQKSVNDFSKKILTEFEYFDYPCNDVSIVANTINVYPNPTQNVLNIEANEDQHITKIEILNLQGVLLKTFITEDCYTSNTLNINDLTNGIYITKVTFDNGKQATKRFFKY